MAQPIFEGVATALITPFKEDKIDWQAFERIIEFQIENGVDALVVCGTTGEGSTLSDEEHRQCIKFVVDKAAHRIPVIAGTGSNDTAYCLDLTTCACQLGVDGVLVVTPYYNKATQGGLIEVFMKVADTSTAPVILYNVPSRTGVNIKPQTYEKLVQHENIVAIKEANGNISSVVETCSLIGKNACLYSGNDDQIVPIMSLGAKGVISVLSNVVPKQTVEMAHAALDGDFKKAAEIQLGMHDLVDALFSEVNPIPVKAACAKMGLCENCLRLPLTKMQDETKLTNALKKHGVI